MMKFDFEEALGNMKKLSINMAERQIEQIFEKYDTNKDGKLDKTEARKFSEEVF